MTLVERLRKNVQAWAPTSDESLEAHTMLDEAAYRIEALEAENFDLAAGQCPNVVGDEGGTPRCKEIDALRAEVAALRKDAERYRHMRDMSARVMMGPFPAVEVPRDWLADEATADTDDAAIDTAIQQLAAGDGNG